MPDVHEQLVAALRVIIAQSDDPWAIIGHAMEDMEREQTRPVAATGDEVPGPYSPNALSIYAERRH
jgi:hypothetical protein